MITIENIMSIDKEALPAASERLDDSDIAQLVEWLALKDDNVRYRAFLLLQNHSISAGNVYPYWDIFYGKLKCDNSYQRSIGLMLIAEKLPKVLYHTMLRMQKKRCANPYCWTY